jgi:hypothetical protein
MRGVDLLWLSLLAAQSQHGTRDFILAVSGKRRTASRAFSSSFVM